MERVSFFFFTFSFCHVLPLLTNEWTKWSVSGGFFTLLPQSRVCQVDFLPFCHKVECVRWVFTLQSQSGVRQVFFYPSATKWSASGGFSTLLPQSGVRQVVFLPFCHKVECVIFFVLPFCHVLPLLMSVQGKIGHVGFFFSTLHLQSRVCQFAFDHVLPD